MAAAYVLAAGRGRRGRSCLSETVVLIDPLVNPDGRERYVSCFEQDPRPGAPTPTRTPPSTGSRGPAGARTTT